MLNKNIALTLANAQKERKLLDLLTNLINAIADNDKFLADSIFSAIITANAGITFPNAQTASVDPNTLDDYEEGTWVPIDSSGAALAFTLGFLNSYVKIGKLVFVTGDVTYPATASVLAAVIGGLPFTSLPNTQQDFSVGFTTFANPFYCVIAGATKTIVMFNSVGLAQLTNVNLTGKVVRFTCCYIANQ